MNSELLDFPDVIAIDNLAELRNKPHILERIHGKKWFSSKYWPAQKRVVEEMTEALFQQNPTLPVKQVVIQILTDLPDFLPSWNIHRVTGYITQTWKELSKADEAPEPKEV